MLILAVRKVTVSVEGKTVGQTVNLLVVFFCLRLIIYKCYKYSVHILQFKSLIKYTFLTYGQHVLFPISHSFR